MSYFKAKMHQIRSAGAPPRTPLVEFTALPQTLYLGLRGPILLREGKGGEGKRRRGEGKGG